MKGLLLCLVLLCPSCVATSAHVERGDRIVAQLAEEIAYEHPENRVLKKIARQAGEHAQESAGFDLMGMISGIGDLIPGGWMTLVGVLFAALGLPSPLGIIRKVQTPKNKQEQCEKRS